MNVNRKTNARNVLASRCRNQFTKVGEVLKRESVMSITQKTMPHCYTHIIDRSAKRLCYVEFMYQTVNANILFDEGIQC